MATHKSAKKASRQQEKRAVINAMARSQNRTAVRKLRLALDKKKPNKTDVLKLFTEAESLLHRSASRGVYHANKASRDVSRLQKAVVAKIPDAFSAAPKEATAS